MEEYSHVGLLLEFDFSELLSGSHHVLVLNSHKTTTPDSSELFVIVELGSEVLAEELQVLIVFLSHVGEGNSGGIPFFLQRVGRKDMSSIGSTS